MTKFLPYGSALPRPVPSVLFYLKPRISISDVEVKKTLSLPFARCATLGLVSDPPSAQLSFVGSDIHDTCPA